MTIRQLAQILLSLPDLDKEVKVAFGCAIGEITSLNTIKDCFVIGTSGYDDDKLTVRSKVEVTSPKSVIHRKPQYF